MSTGALAVMIPSPAGDTQKGDVGLDDYAELARRAGARRRLRLWPGSYGETPLDERWQGDSVRDEYEQACSPPSRRAASRCSASAAACS